MLHKQVKDILAEKITILEKKEENVCLVGPIQLPVKLEEKTVMFQWYSWLTCKELPTTTEGIVEMLSSVQLADMQQSSVLVYGDFNESKEALIRMHSICHTGDIFGSQKCDCGYQLKQSMKMIVEKGSGALFYLANHEGRGIGLFSKAMAYLLQEQGYDTVEANLELGFRDDSRSYEDAILVLNHLRPLPVTLITNNPKKLEALKQAGLSHSGHTPLWGGESPYNEKYLETKIEKSGHMK